jgi:hypothetical protein
VEVTLSGAGHSETALLSRICQEIWARAIKSQCGSGRGGWPYTKYHMRIAEILTELDFMGSPCTKDCSGHQAGYMWSLNKGGRVANSWSNSFNNGAAIGHKQATQRPQGGGKRAGYTSQTPGAMRRRNQRLAAQQAAQAAVAAQQPPQV